MEGQRVGPGGRLIFRITQRHKLARIVDLLGYDPSLVLHVNFGLLEDDCCRTAFVRGAFLAGGSVTDPEKRYHLELATSHTQASREVSALLTEMGFLPHSVRRSGSSVIYFKQSEHIEDLLTFMGAGGAAMRIMDQRMYNEMRNKTNRLSNCETANISKSVNAAVQVQLAIEKLQAAGALNTLPETLRHTARLRMQYPDLPLAKLAQKFDPPVSKAGLSHRMKKIQEAAARLDAAPEPTEKEATNA